MFRSHITPRGTSFSASRHTISSNENLRLSRERTRSEIHSVMALMDAPDVSGTQFGQLHVADRLDDVADGPFDVARCTATVSHGVLGEVALRPSRDDGRIARCLAAGDLAHCRPG